MAGAHGHDRSGSARPARRKRSILWRIRRGLFLLGLVAMVGVAAAAAAISRLELPDPEELLQTSYICAGDVVEPGDCTADTAMAQLGDSNRTYVPLDEMPQHLIDAVISVEDRQFYEHEGVSLPAIARAVYQDFRGAGVQQGGSTITQQYIKNAYLDDTHSYDRKIREAVLAMKLEQQMPKDEILEAYLNTIWLGRQSLGVQGASRVYFDKDVQDLTLPESALLAGLIRAPGLADPDVHPDEADRRRSAALEAMWEEGYITEDERTLADADDWSSVIPEEDHQVINTSAGTDIGSEYVTAYILEQLRGEPFNYSEEEISGDGLRVYTTLDMDLQRIAFDTIYHPETGILRGEDDPPASLVSLDDRGRIVAMVGGRNFDDSNVNLATRGRQVGSTFKTVALAAVVQDDYSLTRSTLNSPGRFEDIYSETDYEPVAGCAEEWSVGNYADTEHTGRMDLVQATAKSSNTAYAQIMLELGSERVWDMASDLGIAQRPENPCPPSVLGTENTSALEMAEVYSTFANQGVHYEPQIITRVERVDADGNVEVDWEDDEEARSDRVLTEDKANLVTHALRNAVEDGTAAAAQLEGWPAAAKTGTTSSNKDAYLGGYVPGFTTSVWMGYPDADWPIPDCDPDNLQEGQPADCLEIPPMNETGRQVQGQNVTGGSFPAQIWQAYMTAVLADQEPRQFTEPSEEQLTDGRTLGEELVVEQPRPGNNRPPEDQLPTETIPGPSIPEVTVPPDIDPCNRENPPGWCGRDDGGGGDDDGGGDICEQDPSDPSCSDTIPTCPPTDPLCAMPEEEEAAEN